MIRASKMINSYSPKGAFFKIEKECEMELCLRQTLLLDDSVIKMSRLRGGG